MPRALRTILLLIPLLALGCAAEAPEPGGLEALAASVEIIRDTYGVPHIYAPTDAGVVFGAAWAQVR